MGDSSAVLNTSIRYAVIAAGLLRSNLVIEQVVSWKGTRGEKTARFFFFFILDRRGWLNKMSCDLHTVTHFHLLGFPTELHKLFIPK